MKAKYLLVQFLLKLTKINHFAVRFWFEAKRRHKLAADRYQLRHEPSILRVFLTSCKPLSVSKIWSTPVHLWNRWKVSQPILSVECRCYYLKGQKCRHRFICVHSRAFLSTSARTAKNPWLCTKICTWRLLAWDLYWQFHLDLSQHDWVARLSLYVRVSRTVQLVENHFRVILKHRRFSNETTW